LIPPTAYTSVTIPGLLAPIFMAERQGRWQSSNPFWFRKLDGDTIF